MKVFGPILAVLAIIGGIDLRPRLGGVVQHDEFGQGTVTAVKNKRVVVLFETHKPPKLCPCSQLNTVSVINIRVSRCQSARSCGVTASTLDFESKDPSSNLGRTCFFSFFIV